MSDSTNVDANRQALLALVATGDLQVTPHAWRREVRGAFIVYTCEACNGTTQVCGDVSPGKLDRLLSAPECLGFEVDTTVPDAAARALALSQEVRPRGSSVSTASVAHLAYSPGVSRTNAAREVDGDPHAPVVSSTPTSVPDAADTSCPDRCPKPCRRMAHQQSYLEQHWTELSRQKGRPLTDTEKAWNVPVESDNLQWSAEQWSSYCP